MHSIFSSCHVFKKVNHMVDNLIYSASFDQDLLDLWEDFPSVLAHMLQEIQGTSPSFKREMSSPHNLIT